MTRYKIDGNEMWLFYDKPNFEDLLFTATGPVDWTGVSGTNNDRVSSIRLVIGEWGMLRFCHKFNILLGDMNMNQE
jgi:hypothetical protein